MYSITSNTDTVVWQECVAPQGIIDFGTSSSFLNFVYSRKDNFEN